MEAFNPRNHTLILLEEFQQFMEQGFPFNLSPIPEEDSSFVSQLAALKNAIEQHKLDYFHLGQAWCSRLFRNYPGFAPHLDRFVLWHFGGEALHILADKEIETFQKLDEDWIQAIEKEEPFDYLKEITNRFSK